MGRPVSTGGPAVGRTWLTNGTICHVREGRAERGAVLVDGGAIAAVTSEADPRGEDRVIDMNGRWLLPGLIDCHVHLTLNPDARTPEEYRHRTPERIRADTTEAARRTLLGGVTTVRDCGGWDYIEMAVRQAVEAGESLGPRMVLSGKLIWVETPGADDYPGMYELAKTPDELAAAATRQLEHGADFIKIMATGMFLAPEGEKAESCFYTVEELTALTRFAHGRGVKVACHAHSADGIRNAIAARVDSIEHGTYADDPALEEMAAHGIYVVPTCMVMAVALEDPEIRAAAPAYIVERYREAKVLHNKAIGAAARHRVPIAMGTDAGAPGVRHGRNGEEVGRMVRDAGLNAAHALRAATCDAARLLGLDDRIGALEPGLLADVIAVDDDPFRDPRTLERVSFVMHGGRVVRDGHEPAGASA